MIPLSSPFNVPCATSTSPYHFTFYFFFHFPIPCCQTSQLGMPVPVARRWQYMELNDSIRVQAMCLLVQVSSSAGSCGLVRALLLAALGGLKAMYIV